MIASRCKTQWNGMRLWGEKAGRDWRHSEPRGMQAERHSEPRGMKQQVFLLQNL